VLAAADLGEDGFEAGGEIELFVVGGDNEAHQHAASVGAECCGGVTGV
jgi:hypothetical protein